MTGRITIRSLRAQDADRLVDMGWSAFSSLGHTTRLKEAMAMRFLAVNAKEHNVIAVVAEAGSELLGYAIGNPFTPSTNEAIYWGAAFKLNKLFVAPTARTAGVGKLLVQHFEKRARKLGFGLLIANINSSSATFYDKTEWTVSGRDQAVSWIDPETEEDRARVPAGSPLAAFKKVSAVRGQPPFVAAGFDLMAYKLISESYRLPVWFHSSDEETMLQESQERLADLIEIDRTITRNMHISAFLFVQNQLNLRLGQWDAGALASEILANGRTSNEEMLHYLAAAGMTPESMREAMKSFHSAAGRSAA